MRIHYKLPIAICLLVLLSGSMVAAALRPVHASHAMVASVHELASRAGVEMMQASGNAVDAAVATGFALAVVHPQAGNLGGGGFLLLRKANGEVHFVDFREKAPAAATQNMYLDAQGNVIENASLVGYKAIGVPGSVAGLVYAEKKFGKLSLQKVMAPAIHLAHYGFTLAWEDAEDLRDDDLAKFPASKRIFQRDGDFYKEGDTFKQPELAATLTEEEVAGLYAVIGTTLTEAVERARGLPLRDLKAEKKSGLRVHGRKGEPCPVCGDTIREVSFSDSALQYCPTCQTGGKPLADRRLSRLLK